MVSIGIGCIGHCSLQCLCLIVHKGNERKFLKDSLIAEVFVQRLYGECGSGAGCFLAFEVSPLYESITLIRRGMEGDLLSRLRLSSCWSVRHGATLCRFCRGRDLVEDTIVFHTCERTRDNDITEAPCLFLCKGVDIVFQ